MLLLHESCDGAEASRGRRSEARAIQVQGRHRCVRQESLRRWRNRHPVERRKRLMTEVVYYPQQKARVIDIAYGIIEHSGEHYGQLVVYYRLAGLVPPESRPRN